MVVQHNMTAINANRYYGINNSKLSSSLEKLSSGYAINRAGDNAAGLAVSEKMRAQIAGIDQGVTNAEDGISMVQTFEGALTETDSILQRMRVLAEQSANGTYQDDVDREAIQLEFDQLNDELNQIADTDFNGVVVLNGGQMADGLSAVNGVFDYSNATRDARQLTSADVTAVDYQLFDDSDTTNGTTANAVWNTIGGWDRTDTDSTNDGPESVDVTLQYDATSSTWTAISATNGADYTTLTVNSTDNGGFELTDGTNTIANVVIDQSVLQNGDTITLTLNNPMSSVSAPTNAGSTVSSSNIVEGSDDSAVTLQDMNLTVELGALTDSDMTESISNIYSALQGATLSVTYAADGTETVSLTMSDGSDSISLDSADGTYTLMDGTQFYAKTEDGVTTISTVSSGTAGSTLLTLEWTDQESTANGSTGTIGYTVDLEFQNYDATNLPSVTVKSDDSAVSKSNSNDAATATLTYSDNITLQVGARTKDSVNFTFSYSSNGIGDLEADLDCSARGLGTDQLSLGTQESANEAIDKIDNAINKVSMVRATFGSIQNRLEHKIDNLNVTSENLTSAESRIRDTDMATEMTNFTKYQILAQASQSMLAQANTLPQGVLSLLQ